MAIDKLKIAEYLQRQGEWQGSRCKDARNSDNGDVIAAATVMSVLNELQYVAEHKRLSSEDIQVYMDAFMATAKMVSVEGRMGGTHFERIEE